MKQFIPKLFLVSVVLGSLVINVPANANSKQFEWKFEAPVDSFRDRSNIHKKCLDIKVILDYLMASLMPRVEIEEPGGRVDQKGPGSDAKRY